MPSWALRESLWALYLKLRFLGYGFRMTFSGIRILMRSPRKPIKHCTFSGFSRGLDLVMMRSCLFTNACQTCHGICWCCLVFLNHCCTEENSGTPAKTCLQNHFRTALHYIYADALETCGLESFADRRDGHCHGFVEGLTNSEHTNDLPLLPDWSLMPATCVMQVITLNCALEHLASKKVQSHILSIF